MYLKQSALSDCLIFMHKKIERSTERICIIKNEIVSEGVHMLSLEYKPSFIPGQVIALTTNFALEPRLYSIARGIHDPCLHILFDIKPAGKLSPLLAGLTPGEHIYIAEPGGSFIYDKMPAVWIAAVTGIAPFLSMLRLGLSQRKMLVQEARTIETFFSGTISANIKRKLCTVLFRREIEGISQGRVSAFLENIFVPDAAILHYICGSAEFIVDIREILITRGIPFEHIITEIYF